MDYSVREANSEDLDVLVSFVAAEAREAEGIVLAPEILAEGISFGLKNRDLVLYWVVETRNKEVVGNISIVKEWSDWNAGFYWWVQSIYVKPAFRGKQLARLLLQHVTQEGREEKAVEVRLYTCADNHRAIAAYRRAGFTETRYRIMTRPIPGA